MAINPLPFRKRAVGSLGAAALALCLGWAPLTAADTTTRAAKLPSVFTKEAPENRADLLAIQGHVQKVLKQVIACTVGLQVGPSSGSGIIVSADGKVLTAGHVSGAPGRPVTIVLPDGRKVRGKTLGMNRSIDSGMVQIAEKGPWPFVKMGNSASLKKGAWCLAIGHPGGYKVGRTPVVRLGRVLDVGSKIVRTDCTLVGGDSGGPLFGMDGKVIGIHSRIGNSLAFNIHVPVDTYSESWDRLVKSDVWGADAYIGVVLDDEAKMCRIKEVSSGSPAEKAGLQPDDIVLRLAGKRVESVSDLTRVLDQYSPGNEVALEVRRGTERLMLRLVLGKRPS